MKTVADWREYVAREYSGPLVQSDDVEAILADMEALEHRIVEMRTLIQQQESACDGLAALVLAYAAKLGRLVQGGTL